MNEEIKHKKRLRLKYFNYEGYYSYFVTICTLDKKEIFIDKSIVNPIVGFLKELSSNYNFIVYAYCFMPDHLHLLLQGNDEKANLKKFVSMFKQKSGFWYKKKFDAKLWQINYYEHVLRKEKAIKEIAYYIFANPVRQKLIEDYRDYPFSGSFEFDIKQGII